jgi:hypothetical protein
MENSPLDAGAEIEFTLSEIDELETIELPRSEQPDGLWVKKETDCLTHFPGMGEDWEAEIELERKLAARFEIEATERFNPPVEPDYDRLNALFPFPGGLLPRLIPAMSLEERRLSAFNPTVENRFRIRTTASIQLADGEEVFSERGDTTAEVQVDATNPQQDSTFPSRPKRRRPHRCPPGDGIQDQEQPLLPPRPLRRSARVAVMNTPKESFPSEQTTNNRSRRTRTTPTYKRTRGKLRPGRSEDLCA